MERTELENGLELVHQEPPAGAATFALTFISPAGWAFDPPTRAGRAVILSELLPCGAGARDRAEVARLLDRCGGTLTSHCHPESIELTLWGPSSELPTLVPLLAEAIRSPRFDPREIDRVRRQLAERQMRERTQPDRCAEKELFHRVFPPGHPYRETGLGTSDTLDAIGPEDLRLARRTHLLHRGASLVATTRDPIGRIARRLESAFGRSSLRAAPPPVRIPPPGPSGAEPVRLRVEGGSQVEIRIGGAALARSDPDYPAAFLANEILGGRSLLSRLFDHLRERRGLVYHAASELDAMRWGGYWTAEAGTEPRRVPGVLKLMDSEIRAMGRREAGSAEVERIRESLIGSVWMELENTSTAHEFAVDVAYHHLAEDFYASWPGTLRAIAPRAIREAAARILDPDRASTVLAGPSAPVG
ncbi:MAG: M16 family metallopeptidase, partial [Thermoplasmata archaeon]